MKLAQYRSVSGRTNTVGILSFIAGAGMVIVGALMTPTIFMFGIGVFLIILGLALCMVPAKQAAESHSTASTSPSSPAAHSSPEEPSNPRSPAGPPPE